MTTISAEVVADSISVLGVRITTMLLTYPRWIHAEFMTHRAFSRNASSSRAIPVAKLIQSVRTNPAVPLVWSKNQAGMQSSDENYAEPVSVPTPSGGCTDETAAGAYRAAADWAVRFAEAFSEAGYHKQVVNRLLEPFSHIKVLVTATEWDNFFALRRHPLAEPHMRMLAEGMWNVREHSCPQPLASGEWHLPFITERERDLLAARLLDTNTLLAISAARCARTSYLTHDHQEPKIQADIDLFRKLASNDPMHASPMEHQAVPDIRADGSDAHPIIWAHPHLHGNFVGMCQHRRLLEEAAKGMYYHG